MYLGEYSGNIDPFGSNKENLVSHVAYGNATLVVIFDEEGRIEKITAAHDIGRAINPTGVDGKAEVGVVVVRSYALTEDSHLKEDVPKQSSELCACAGLPTSLRSRVFWWRRIKMTGLWNEEYRGDYFDFNCACCGWSVFEMGWTGEE
ncbi:molybdopterin cofactor-binding domain-containing protein [Desulfitobacterium sp. AusDCA]|uniref:molybdopterin cofactor-binding domain-containing protein n=1 Tax=Desulfitobacterium sp. AusDCA TaxID=3240383 RepID=UPI003DA781A0